MRPVVFSASSVNAYLDCHLRWYFSYVAGEEGEQSEAQRVGIAVHDAAEFYLRGEGMRTMIEVTPRGIEKGLAFIGDEVTHPLIDIFLRDILSTYQEPVLIEAEFQLVVNDIPFSGIIDSVDNRKDGLVLRDLKTTGSRPSPGRHRFAMTGYWLGATDLGYPPDAAQLDWIVRTRKPYYWPEVMEPITEDDISAFAATLERVADGVERGDYAPTGLGTYVCSYCPHKAICGPYQRYAAASSPLRKEVDHA